MMLQSGKAVQIQDTPDLEIDLKDLVGANGIIIAQSSRDAESSEWSVQFLSEVCGDIVIFQSHELVALERMPDELKPLLGNVLEYQTPDPDPLYYFEKLYHISAASNRTSISKQGLLQERASGRSGIFLSQYPAFVKEDEDIWAIQAQGLGCQAGQDPAWYGRELGDEVIYPGDIEAQRLRWTDLSEFTDRRADAPPQIPI